MIRNTKASWIKEGLVVLAELGNAGLTIDELTKRLKVTKGSFYHHFKNRRDFSEQLLLHWEDQMTLDIIQASREAATYEDRNRKLLELSNKTRTYELEVAIRAWALRDPLARTYQERVDQHRIQFLKELYLLNTDESGAEKMALIRYSFIVGAQQIIPNIKGEIFNQLFNSLHDAFEKIK